MATEISEITINVAQGRYNLAIKEGSMVEFFLADRMLAKTKSQKSPSMAIGQWVKKQCARPQPFFRANRVHIDGETIQVFLVKLDTKRVLLLDVNDDIYTALDRHNVDITDSWFSLNGKPLRRGVSLRDSGVGANAMITHNAMLKGGSAWDYRFRAYTHVYESEKRVLGETMRLQADQILGIGEASFVDEFAALRDSLDNIVPKEHVWMVDMIENLVHTAYWLRKCVTKTDYVACVALSYRLITGQGVGRAVWNAFGGSDLQADVFSDSVHTARDMFGHASRIAGDPLLKKIKQIYTYMLVHGFLTKLGMSVSVEEYLQMEKKVPAKSDGTVLMTIIETAIQVCERIDAYRLTGDWMVLIHSEASYTNWLKEADRIICLANFTSNLEPHGTTYFKYIADLSDAIEKGEAISKYSRKVSGVESTFLQKKLASLQLLKNTEVTRRASQRERKAPFGVLIHGGSSVGKSSFTKMLFYYYGKIHGLESDDHFRYVRSPTDEYWSNFDTSKWCIQMDDIAFLDPKKSSDVDPTLKELLNVVNNVPFVPPQAALEDKGRTPVMARLVLATTNTPYLNAKEYFACPLAVQRRLAYVVKVEPKAEYLASNNAFLDPAKLPQQYDGFPDFWKITVQKLVPARHGTKDVAELVDDVVFTDVREFLKHFAHAGKQHETNQASSSQSDEHMSSVRVCRLCYEVGPTCECVQSFAARFIWGYVGLFTCNLLSTLFATFLSCQVAIWATKFYIPRRVFAWYARFLNKEVQLKYFSLANNGQTRTLSVSVASMLRISVTILKWIMLYKAARFAADCMSPVKPTVVPTKVEEEVDDDASPVNLQGNVFGTTEDQLKKEELRNVWYNPTLELSQFDVPVASRSMAGITDAEVRDMLSQNCVCIDVRAQGALVGQRMHAVYLRGQYLCFNRHALRDGQQFTMLVQQQSLSQGLTGNLTCYFNREEVVELADVDLVIYRVKNAPPKKDILKLWNDAQLPITRMLSVRRDFGGSVTYQDVFNVHLLPQFPIEELKESMDVYLGVGVVDTQAGDCGSLGVAMTPRGPVIMGLHTIGYKTNCGFPHVTRSRLLDAVPALAVAVASGPAPKLRLNGENVILPPHHKSVFRYLNEGVANVYGSLGGFRAKPRSRVTATPLQETMCKHFGCDVGFDRPVMTGWEPVYNNVKDMVRPNTQVDQMILDRCVQSFLSDIVGGLKQAHGEEWKKQLCVLSDAAAVNGLPGVRFIDGLNKNTSMGHPWNTTKKQFLVPAISEKYPEGVDFTEEVWERVRNIEAVYERGERAFPVFVGHLKDEPVSHSKIERKKTRLFTGAPVDWSIVCRKHLLSFVALLQKNKFVFEAAPGTIAQSREWTDIYEHLTAHGMDQIVGGDYSAYDKGMIATFVLAAFEIIKGVMLEAGFPTEELTFVDCIGMDTAFPLTNLGGDLVEFFGTNPSGHSLTVVVNSLANSLYMRYAYCVLNPRASVCDDFKCNVNLITYGDDNGMGVSRKVPWFNHTAIQHALKGIGVTYTMADKESESRPYIRIDEFTFLKRAWRLEPELGMYACPLEEASIHKSLTVWVPSRTIDEFAQMVAVIVAANNEYFFFGREVFEKHHAFFAGVLAREPYNIYAASTYLPGWNDLIERFREANKALVSTT